MKYLSRLSIAGILAALSFAGCKMGNQEVNDRLSALEKRVEQLEKRPMFPARQMPPAQEKAYNLPVGSSYVMGKKDAGINIVIFSDYQCPFCGRTEELFKEVMKDGELKEKVNVVFKHFPLSFHQNAKPASKAALAAGEQGNDKFWAMSTKLYSNQQDLSAENFKKWAKEIGLKVDKFEADLKNNDAKYEAVIKADTDLGTNEGHVRGTPSIYVNGWELKERSVDGIKEVIKDKKL